MEVKPSTFVCCVPQNDVVFFLSFLAFSLFTVFLHKGATIIEWSMDTGVEIPMKLQSL